MDHIFIPHLGVGSGERGAHDVVTVFSHVGQLKEASFVTVSLFEGHLGR